MGLSAPPSQLYPECFLESCKGSKMIVRTKMCLFYTEDGVGKTHVKLLPILFISESGLWSILMWEPFLIILYAIVTPVVLTLFYLFFRALTSGTPHALTSCCDVCVFIGFDSLSKCAMWKILCFFHGCNCVWPWREFNSYSLSEWMMESHWPTLQI